VARARDFLRDAQQRMSSRADWFQGRELVEALQVRMAAFDGGVSAAIDRLETALALAETFDFYIAAWLAAACAKVMAEHDPIRFRASVERYAPRVGQLGYSEMTRRYEGLTRT
jgi:hypothetical protein